MSINGIMGAGLSGLQSSQAGLRVAGNNITNANTPGYARQLIDYNARNTAGAVDGVDVARIRRAADRFLEAAALRSGAVAGRESLRADFLDRAQARFGDPTQPGSLPGRLQRVFDSATTAQADPTSTLRRADFLGAVDQFFSDVRGVATGLTGLRAEADQRIGEAVTKADTLIQTIQRLNIEISRAQAGGGDSTGAEGEQASAVTELAKLLDIRTEPRANGGINVRTTEGHLLIGETAARLTYTAKASGEPGTVYGKIEATLQGGSPVNLEVGERGGEIGGLLRARDVDLPALQDDLSALMATVADGLNRVATNATGVPAPQSVVGNATGLLAGDAMNFTGRTTVAIVNADGTLRRRVDIDFSAAPWAGSTVGSFTASLNAALGADGTAAFGADGRLSINAVAGAGVAIQQDPTQPSDRVGRGFAQTFGLGALTSAPFPTTFETGLTGASPAGFNPGGQIELRLTAADGRVISTPVIPVAGPTMANMIASLNAGLGGAATAALDPQGRLVITPSGGGATRIEVVSDTTQRGATGTSFTQLFGMGDGARAQRIDTISLNSQMTSDPSRVPFAELNLTGAVVGDRVLEAGDARGAAAFTQLRGGTVSFGGSASVGAGSGALSDIAARVVGAAGRMAAEASRSAAGAKTIEDASSTRLAQATGVNLDEEIVRMTTFQQSYAASARLIQSAQQMYDTLLQII
jgi:flagellar hook-associated protein 1